MKMMAHVSGWFGRPGKGTWHFALLLLCLCLFNPGAAMSQGCVTTPACKPQFKYEGLNGLVTINNCKTTNTSSSCAWANVTLQSSNFLACRLEDTGPIALCYYSGVPGSTVSGSTTDTPGCVLSADKKTATCECYQISKDNPAGATYSYVDINAILNKAVYLQTIKVCGKDGSKCLNGANVATNPKMRQAPVCNAIRKKTLFPGADVVSDYTPILIPSKGETSYDCPTSGTSNIYAGCMTAPCRATGRTDPSTGLPLVSCECPTFDGPNQVGNPLIEQVANCSPDPYVWSSAYKPPTMPTVP
ncbi:MAG: hypothetical protein RJA94_2307 [Pseudomonadota bacterium]|jgi:hypothetical protein